MNQDEAIKRLMALLQEADSILQQTRRILIRLEEAGTDYGAFEAKAVKIGLTGLEVERLRKAIQRAQSSLAALLLFVECPREIVRGYGR